MINRNLLDGIQLTKIQLKRGAIPTLFLRGKNDPTVSVDRTIQPSADIDQNLINDSDSKKVNNNDQPINQLKIN